jgi:hypothetical protein
MKTLNFPSNQPTPTPSKTVAIQHPPRIIPHEAPHWNDEPEIDWPAGGVWAVVWAVPLGQAVRVGPMQVLRWGSLRIVRFGNATGRDNYWGALNTWNKAALETNETLYANMKRKGEMGWAMNRGALVPVYRMVCVKRAQLPPFVPWRKKAPAVPERTRYLEMDTYVVDELKGMWIEVTFPLNATYENSRTLHPLGGPMPVGKWAHLWAYATSVAINRFEVEQTRLPTRGFEPHPLPCRQWVAPYGTLRRVAENTEDQVEPHPLRPPKCPELWGAACEALGWPPEPKAYPALRGLWQGQEHRRIIVADGKWGAIPANPYLVP